MQMITLVQCLVSIADTSLIDSVDLLLGQGTIPEYSGSSHLLNIIIICAGRKNFISTWASVVTTPCDCAPVSLTSRCICECASLISLLVLQRLSLTTSPSSLSQSSKEPYVSVPLKFTHFLPYPQPIPLTQGTSNEALLLSCIHSPPQLLLHRAVIYEKHAT